MGRIEDSVRKRRRRRHIQDAVLGAVAVAGILSVAVLVPSALLAAGYVARASGYKLGYRARTAAGRLAQKGLVKFVEIDGKKHIEITEKGKRTAELEIRKAELRARTRRRWDKQYRLVIFDIPEKRKHIRRQLRALMHECGFLRVQNSVWLYPYECEELVALIKAELRTGKDILYVVVESIENDAWIKKHFKLS